MKNILSVFVLLVSSLAFGADGDREAYNQNVNKNYSLCVNKGGVKTCPVVVNGVSGITSISGLSQVEYVGSNPEVGGSTPFQMVSTNKRVQTLNPGGAIVAKLPTTGIVAGEIWEINNRSATAANVVEVQSSNGSGVAYILNGNLKVQAVVDTPTTAAHWYIINYTSTGVQTGSGSGISFTYSWARAGKMVALTIKGTGTVSGNPGTLAASVTNALMPTLPTDGTEPLFTAPCKIASTAQRCLVSIWQAGSSTRVDINKEDLTSFSNGNTFELGNDSGTAGNVVSISYVVP